MKIYLIEREYDKFKYLEEYFKCEDVILVNDSFENFMRENKVQCIVSPANSFGLMDGGYDLAITEWFGNRLQKRVQKYILENFYGEQPVATSFIIDAQKDNQYLIHTPTMRTPQKIVDSRIIYQCMRTTLMIAKKNDIGSILIPMFGTSCGGIHGDIAAKMMHLAYNQIMNPPNEIDWKNIKDIKPEINCNI